METIPDEVQQSFVKPSASMEQQHLEEQAMAKSSNRLDAITQCAQWIADLSSQQHGDSVFPYNTATIEFRHSTLSNNIGVFAKKDIDEDEVLVCLPQEAVLCESHPTMKSKSPSVVGFVDKVMSEYDTFVKDRAQLIRSNDLFYSNNGCVLCPQEARMMVFMTIVIYAMDSLDRSSSISASTSTGINSSEQHFSSMDTTLSSNLVNLANYWYAFLNTWPTNFSTLPMFWSAVEMDTIQGTSFHAYVSRLRQNVDDMWQFVLQPSLHEAGFCIPPPSPSPTEQWGVKLPLFFQRAVGAVYSRSHGAKRKSVDDLMSLFASILGNSPSGELQQQQQQQHWLCPLLDCVNGARDHDIINVDMIKGDDDDDPIKLRTLRSIKSGEELFISYADMPNKDYFAKFGFVPLRRGQPVLHPFDVVSLQTPRDLIPHETDLRWRKLHRYGFTAECLYEDSYFAQPFALIANDNDMRYYRRLPRTADWLEGSPCPQVMQLINFAFSFLANEKELKGIKQEPYVEQWQPGTIVLKIIDFALGKLATRSNEFDMKLLQTQTGNLRMGTYARMLDRELLVKWRHAFCERNFLYEYAEAGVEHVPPMDQPSLCCFVCRTSFRLKRCTQCGVIYYCSVQCQKEDRPRHKKYCTVISDDRFKKMVETLEKKGLSPLPRNNER